jgi:hypothetical protein
MELWIGPVGAIFYEYDIGTSIPIDVAEGARRDLVSPDARPHPLRSGFDAVGRGPEQIQPLLMTIASSVLRPLRRPHQEVFITIAVDVPCSDATAEVVERPRAVYSGPRHKV